jgi:hypothetical protein
MVILNLGPGLIIGLFGLLLFFKNFSPLKLIFFIFAVVSFSLFFSEANVIYQTHNGRFLSPLSYILLAVISVLGIEQMGNFFKKKRVFIAFFITLLIFIYSLLPNITSFIALLNDKNLNSPITYLPKGIIDGFNFLGKYPEKGDVLLTPSQFLGTVLPAFADRKVYVAKHSATPNYIDKNIITSNFYLGYMSDSQAREFMIKNGLKFVILTSIEGYDVQPLFKYSFLKEIYRNKDIIIFITKS